VLRACVPPSNRQSNWCNGVTGLGGIPSTVFMLRLGRFTPDTSAYRRPRTGDRWRRCHSGPDGIKPRNQCKDHRPELPPRLKAHLTRSSMDGNLRDAAPIAISDPAIATAVGSRWNAARWPLWGCASTLEALFRTGSSSDKLDDEPLSKTGDVSASVGWNWDRCPRPAWLGLWRVAPRTRNLVFRI